jgi:methionyl-tRNA formyltransferase
MQPWPTAYTFLRRAHQPEAEPLRLIVHETEPLETPTGGVPGAVSLAAGDLLVVAAGVGSVRLLTVQIAGKKPMPVADFLRGHMLVPGDRFGPS